jgi:predicted amidohydrolase YtcJ
MGRLAEGYLADFVVLTDDLLTSEPERLLHTEVAATVVGGDVVYAAPEFVR